MSKTLKTELVADFGVLTGSRPVIGLLVWEDEEDYKIYWNDGPITSSHSHPAWLDKWRENLKKML